MHLKESVYMVSTQALNQKVVLIKTSFNQKAKLTKTSVDRILLPASGQYFIRDTELHGFALRVTPGAKSFVVEKRIAGKVKRMTLGRYPELTVEQARKKAHKYLGDIATGINPIAEKAKIKLVGTTLDGAFEDFLRARKSLKPKTVYDYRRLMAVAFADWQSRPLVSLNKDMIAKRHKQLGEGRGEAYANLAMRFLRALFNFAMVQYEAPDGTPMLRPSNTEPVAKLVIEAASPEQLARRLRELLALFAGEETG